MTALSGIHVMDHKYLQTYR